MNYHESLSFIAPFIPNRQLIVIQLAAQPGKEEYKFFEDKVKSLAALIEGMPKVYEQDGKGDAAIVYLHYFLGSYHWFITEKDTDKSQNQAFGWADLACGEFGYISLAELKKTGAELDLYWEPKTLGEAKSKIAAPEVIKVKAEEENLPDILDLNDWLFNNHKDYFGATKYLSNPYDTWLSYWRDQGSPEIREPATVEEILNFSLDEDEDD